MTSEEKAKAYADKKIKSTYGISSKAFREAGCRLEYEDVVQAYEDGATEALASQWKDPKLELPEVDAQVVGHSPNGRYDVLTFHDGVFIDELGQAHCVDCYLPIPPLKGGEYGM